MLFLFILFIKTTTNKKKFVGEDDLLYSIHHSKNLSLINEKEPGKINIVVLGKTGCRCSLGLYKDTLHKIINRTIH